MRYAHDLDAGKKHKAAKNIVAELWESRNGIISTQVLQEFYVTLTRKIQSPVKRAPARQIIKNYLSWDLVVNDGLVILHASEIEEIHRISFRDAMIVAAAYSKNSDIIMTEDMAGGQKIEGIRIVNHFESL
jgi:predicted nucleic acid-binding protein